MIRITRHRLTTTLAVAWLALAAVSPALAAADATGDAAAFEALKALAGEWRGTYGAGGGGMRFEVTSGGHTVVQTEFPGEAHEMRTLYWLEDGELVARHFCMLGNQPRYEVESADGGATLRYVFAGGSNLDPETDQHAHEGVLRIGLDDVLESTWTFWKDGGPHETSTFRLERTK